MPQNNVIDIERLVKRFGNYAAVDGLDLTVRTGERGPPDRRTAGPAKRN